MPLNIGLPDWKNKSEYPEPKKLPLLGWCWEFIRRNVEYQNDWITQNIFLASNPEQEKLYHEYIESKTPPKKLDINSDVYNLAKKWGFNICLLTPKYEFRQIHTHAFWPSKRFKPEIFFPVYESNHKKYSLHETNRLALVFNLEESWIYQIDDIRHQILALCGVSSTKEKLKDQDLSKFLPQFSDQYVNLNHKPASSLNDDILIISGLNAFKEKESRRIFAVSAKLSEPNGRAFINLIPRIESQFKKFQQKKAYIQKANISNFPTYLRILDAVFTHANKQSIGRVLFPKLFNETRSGDSLSLTTKVNDTIAGANRLRDELAIKLLKSLT